MFIYNTECKHENKKQNAKEEFVVVGGGGGGIVKLKEITRPFCYCLKILFGIPFFNRDNPGQQLACPKIMCLHIRCGVALEGLDFACQNCQICRAA